MKVLSILLLSIFVNVFDTINVTTDTYKVKILPSCVSVKDSDFHIRILTEKGKINLLTIKHKQDE